MGCSKSFPKCVKLFQRAGWFNYFEKIDGYHFEVSHGFSQGLEKDAIMLNTLKIELTTQLIDKATNITDEGEFWF